MTPEEFDLRVGFPPEEDPGFHAPPDPDRPRLDPALLGLKVTPANVEALRTARAVEAFKDDVLDDEAARLRMFMAAAKLQAAEHNLAQARKKPKSNPLAEALRVVADDVRKKPDAKLWPSVRDAMLKALLSGAPLPGDLVVVEIAGQGFADTYCKADLTGINITFELPDGTQRTISGATTYGYVMRK